MSALQPSEEAHWVEKIRRNELTRCALALNKLAAHIPISEDYVSKTPIILANLISEITKILADKIPSEVPETQLEQVNTFLGVISSHLRYVERAKVTQTPWSIVQPAEKLLQLVTSSDSLFIIRPRWTYNYSLTSDFWGSYKLYLSSCTWFPLDELRKKVNIRDDQKIYCLSFPRIERSNCLLHANWGHEVGHILAKAWNDDGFNNAWAAAEPDIKARIEKIVRQNPPSYGPLFQEKMIENTVAQNIKSTLKVAQQGLIELLCDRIGVHLFGPSALASAIEFAARFALDVSPLQAEDYPPWRYRLRKMVEFCKFDLDDHSDSGYPDEVLKPFVEWLKIGRKLSESTSDLDVLKANTITNEAYIFIEKYWESASSAVTNMLPQELAEPYSLKKSCCLITDLVDRIKKGIPPNEPKEFHGIPASLQDILCSAWAFKILKFASDPNWGKADDYDLLFRLILKACECSYVYSEWSSTIK
jgi:hypothetical protein